MSKTKKPEVEAKYPKHNALWKVGEKALTFEEAKKFLGWREDTPEEKFTEFDVELPNGRRVIFDNNRKNRPWNNVQLKVLKQEHLNRNWRLNPDGIGIGMFESIMSGQHRLRSFCEAEIERQDDPKKWGEEPLTMECIVVLGLDESDETFRILNTGAPATAADAFYRQGLFPKHVKNNRAKLCQVLETAIRCLWVRTGANKDGYAPESTNSEKVDFYERHPKTAECVVHIFEEYASGKGHAKRMSPGAAAALMWLMGCSGTDVDGKAKYWKNPKDKTLDWSLMSKAADFWTLLCKGEGEFEIVQDVLNKLCSDDPVYKTAGLYDRKVVITRAWNLFRAGETITEDGIAPSDTHPDLGGIDCNESTGAEESEDGDPEVTEEEVEAAKEKIVESKIETDAAPSRSSEETEKADLERKLVLDLRVKHRNKVLLFRGKKEIIVWEEDAKLLGRLIPEVEVKTHHRNEMTYVSWPASKMVALLGKLKDAKKKSLFVTMDKDGTTPICTDPDTGNPI